MKNKLLVDKIDRAGMYPIKQVRRRIAKILEACSVGLGVERLVDGPNQTSFPKNKTGY